MKGTTMKHFTAWLAAFLITAVLGLGILLLGFSTLTNRNTVAMQDSPASVTQNVSAGTGDVQQMQSLINQYQTQLDQANQQIQEYQSLIVALARRGVIVIGNDGRIYLPGTTQ
jgi:uncharacterized protein HemX